MAVFCIDGYHLKLGSMTALEILLDRLGEVNIPASTFEHWNTRPVFFTKRGNDIVITLDAPAKQEGS